MTTLPDLETDEVGFIAYWNMIEDGDRSEAKPEESLEDSNLTEYTLYDNGFDGKFETETGRVVDVRVKTDGWFIAWMDRTQDDNVLDEEDADDTYGKHDVGSHWNDWTEHSNITENNLVLAIKSLGEEQGDWNEEDFHPEDVGLYNYEYPDSEATTLMGTTEGDGVEDELGFVITDGTTVHELIVTGVLRWGRHIDFNRNGSIHYTNPSTGETTIASDNTDDDEQLLVGVYRDDEIVTEEEYAFEIETQNDDVALSTETVVLWE